MGMRLNRRQASWLLAASAVAGPSRSAGLAPSVAGASVNPSPEDTARWLPWPPQRALPALRLPDLQGRDWSPAQELGHPLLLNFWASWCEPCRAEMASFEQLQQQFASRRLKVVAVNFKEGLEVVRRFREAQRLSLALVRDSYGEATRAWGVHSFPTTFVINPAGRAVLQIEGELDWASPAVQQRLQAVL
jgi:thiol-disulfide isomerase/thioredoxin